MFGFLPSWRFEKQILTFKKQNLKFIHKFRETFEKYLTYLKKKCKLLKYNVWRFITIAHFL